MAEELGKVAVVSAVATFYKRPQIRVTPYRLCPVIKRVMSSEFPFRRTDVDIFGSECEVDSL